MNKIIRFVFSIMLAASFAVSPLAKTQAYQAAGQVNLAPLSIGTGKIVPDQYIVVLKPASGQEVDLGHDALAASGGSLIVEYSTALNGFAAILSEKALLELRQNPQVAYVEADRIC